MFGPILLSYYGRKRNRIAGHAVHLCVEFRKIIAVDFRNFMIFRQILLFGKLQYLRQNIFWSFFLTKKPSQE
ncbi:MAG: hypothetical protein D3923_17405 [Candidatus Electrothrix sp. AR3]|nr:hypothetical protein [Candidatus Electrothrix sp. AR3]